MKRKIYYNGCILTMDDHLPQAGYVLTEGEKIVEVGGEEAAAKHIAAGAEPVDLQGRLMLPGFIDSHIHMLTAALNRLKLDISELKFDSIDEMLAYVKDKKKNASETWISVFGFSEENIKSGKMVTKWDIDRFFPDTPVTVIRVCGHISIVNSKAIAQLNPQKMEEINGGEFRKNKAGEYTGVATEGAQQYVLDTMPRVDTETALSYLREEQEVLLKNGITAIHDAGTDMLQPEEYVKVYEQLNARQQLKIRTYLMVRPCDGEDVEHFDTALQKRRSAHPAQDMLQIGAVKLFADGSFGSRTAAVTAPYVDEPENTGLLLQARLDQYVTELADRGNQIAVHAIGDRSTDYVVEAYSKSPKKATDRLRVEHAELLSDALIKKIKDNKILIMTQPIFIREFGNTYFNNLGEDRAMHIQPIKTMLENGIVVGFGTDYPVDDPNPLLGIHTAMTREIKNSSRLLNASERISFTEAVKCYTIRNAYGAFSENCLGSMEQGKLADFVVLSNVGIDRTGQVTDVRQAKVDMTVIGGETVFSREK